MKEVKWINPNKMKFESSHKTFNAQVVCISTGNVIDPVQSSRYIRAYLDEGDREVKKDFGALQKYDLDGFFKGWNIPSNYRSAIERVVADNGRHDSLILYLFHHSSAIPSRNRYGSNYGSTHKTILDGIVLTKNRDNNYEYIKTWYLNQHWKAENAVDEATKYIANSIPGYKEED